MEHKDERKIDFRIFKDIDLFEAPFLAGSEIMGPEKDSRAMYVVKSGVVAVQLQGVTIEKIFEGNIFGELGILDPRPHSATVVALTDVELYIINEFQFLSLVSRTPMFALRVMRILASRLRSMNSRMMEEKRVTA